MVCGPGDKRGAGNVVGEMGEGKRAKGGVPLNMVLSEAKYEPRGRTTMARVNAKKLNSTGLFRVSLDLDGRERADRGGEGVRCSLLGGG